MASLDRLILCAIAVTAACSTPDFAASDADAGAAAMSGGNAGAAGRPASGGTGGASAAGGASASGGKPSATGGSSARGGSTGGSGDTSGGGESETGGSNASTGGSASPGGADGGGTGGSDNSGGTGSSGGTGGSNPGGSGGDTSPAGMGGSGMAGGGTAGLGSGGGGAGGTLSVAGAANAGSGGVIGGCDNQLLANADFEAGPTPSWGEESEWPGLEIIVAQGNPALQAEGVTPYAGSYLAWLGGIPDNEWDHYMVILTQDVTIPTDAATLTLSGQRWVKSVDDPSDIFDVAYLEFDDEAGDVVWQAQAWSNQTTTGGWVSFQSSTNVASALLGKKLTFVAYSRTDPEGKTSFFLDNLRLEASCGR